MFTERGDHIIVEEYTYPAVMETGRPLGVRFTDVKIDEQGAIPESLDELLESWDEVHAGKRPRIIYLVPTGQNPTGATASPDRRRDIYRVAQKWDLYILEDDPYYFFQYEEPWHAGKTTKPVELAKTLLPSYLSMDTDGRVFRMDSLSKIIAPGLRMGWITVSEQVAERFVRVQETSVQNPSGLSQFAMFKLLQHWSHEGFTQWILRLQSTYLSKRDVLKTLIDTHLPSSVISYDQPRAGFFVSFNPSRVLIIDS
jgi:aromatic amino acid aminotransferase I